jgi:hypothetical protein
VAWAKLPKPRLLHAPSDHATAGPLKAILLARGHYGLPGEVDVKHATGQEILDGSSTNSLSW